MIRSAWRYPVDVFRRFVWPARGADFATPEDHGLVPEPFTVTTSDGLRIRGWVFLPPGAWGMVVVCHARNASKSRTLSHARLLVDQGLAVVTFDFRGCGESAAPRRWWRDGLWGPLKDLDAVVRHVNTAHPGFAGRVALLGCSFGGNMAIAHAGTAGRHYPAVVLDSVPLVRWVGMLDTLLRRERRGARFRRTRAVADLLVARAASLWTRAGPLYRHARRSVRALSGTRVLQIVGARDSLFDVEDSCRFLREDCAGAVTVWRVPAGRHLTNHLADPDGYAIRVVSCLRDAFGAEQTIKEEANDRNTVG
ncbi:alpha/beta hydrolase [Actinoplanes xinjiangensis]|uniref:Serine aminopeptidase S33 family n=1 Tax=Actinoplanes xinjiangensis TaxID=512350 RepID=A0A316FA60_9ACTN|nr:alpha/beta fold hydrolase [Actinoplanes xinjiangensis]PWK45218.1 serine aminopeptidase S33 family [Actinoplanes xinjiangensis]GIF41447.1 hypothetical protein Axi01nite_57580 [Actinoplanes xinjiangensis]